jgi:hypothetical protein
MAKWMQMLKGEDNGMGIMAKVDVNVEVVGEDGKMDANVVEGRG